MPAQNNQTHFPPTLAEISTAKWVNDSAHPIPERKIWIRGLMAKKIPTGTERAIDPSNLTRQKKISATMLTKQWTMDISVTSVPDAPTPHAAQRDSGNELQVHGDHLAMPAPRQSTTARRAAPADDTPRTCPVAGPQHSIAATASPATNVSSPTARPSFEAALVRMTAFLNSVCLALQAPLTARPAITTPAAAPTPRRSGRLANQALNSTVRPSKKGEILVMKKLGVVPREQDAEQVSTAEFDKFLHSTMQPKHFAALRDIFPAANALSDDELMRITSLAGGAVAAH